MNIKNHPKVFLSHSTADKPFVRRLDAALRGYGLETFLDERDIMIGEDIPQRLYKEIENATHVCYIISQNSINSRWVQEELSLAKIIEKETGGVFILPILIDDIIVPLSVRSKRYADFRSNQNPETSNPSFHHLLNALGTGVNFEVTRKIIDNFIQNSASAILVLNKLDESFKSIETEKDEFNKYMRESYNSLDDGRHYKPRRDGHNDSIDERIKRENYRKVFGNHFISILVEINYHDIVYKIQQLHECILPIMSAEIPSILLEKTTYLSQLTKNLIEIVELFRNMKEPNFDELRRLPEFRENVLLCQNTIADLQYELVYLSQIRNKIS